MRNKNDGARAKPARAREMVVCMECGHSWPCPTHVAPDFGDIRGLGYFHHTVDGKIVPLSPDIGTLGDVAEEICRARWKFPKNRHMLAALMEEVGELAQAYLQSKPWNQIREEAMQVACVAIRIMEESDSTFSDGPYGHRDTE